MRRPTAARQRVVSDAALPAFPREHRAHDDGPYRLLHREHHRLLAAARLATPSGTRENSSTTRARAKRERFSTARSAEQNVLSEEPPCHGVGAFALRRCCLGHLLGHGLTLSQPERDRRSCSRALCTLANGTGPPLDSRPCSPHCPRTACR